ncbi:MAG: HAD hydrolase-like protein [Akkermansiaceae bacterium]|nr:HAD hydrolase-like protein [Armatimonadota bacterium]
MEDNASSRPPAGTGGGCGSRRRGTGRTRPLVVPRGNPGAFDRFRRLAVPDTGSLGFAQIIARFAQRQRAPLPKASHLIPPVTKHATWHLLFDLDGTLTDPGPGIIGCIAYALTALGFPTPSQEVLRSCIGPPLQTTFPALLGEQPGESSLTNQAIALYRDRFVRVGMYENAVYSGIPELLARLQDARCRLYVATAKPTVFAEEIVRHFGLATYFAAVYGSELSGERSDKSELLAYLLRRENIPPETAIMIGDREHDILAATACALFAAVGVTYGYGSAEELRQAGADALCGAPEGLGDVLDLLAGGNVRQKGYNSRHEGT